MINSFYSLFSMISLKSKVRVLNIYIVVILTMMVSSVWCQGQSRQNYILRGEKITYNVHYGFINAGEFNVSVDSAIAEVDSHYCYRAEVEGHTIGAVGLFSKINDKFVSYIDTSLHLSHKFIRDLHENNYTLLEITEFDRKTNQGLVSKRNSGNSFEMKPHQIKPNVQDIVSTYFAMRNLPFEKLHKNDTLSFNVFFEDTSFIFKIKCLGYDRIKTKVGKFKAIIFSPLLPDVKNSIFSKEDPIKAWITDDNYRIPLKIKVNTKYGAIEADISKYNFFLNQK